jgi:probable rRNA maturation factor
MITIEFEPDYKHIISKRSIASIVHLAFEYFNNITEPDLTIVLTTDEVIQQLNAQYRGFDKPTDVLSFESGEINPETGIPYLGDIVISVPTASRQAHLAGHPIQNEIQLLVIHGLLHLFGYDHDTPAKKEQMWSLQSQFLQQNGILINQLPDGDE